MTPDDAASLATMGPLLAGIAGKEPQKLWLWRNGDHFWAFDNEYPCYPNGDPMTLGEPAGWAWLRPSSPRQRNYKEICEAVLKPTAQRASNEPSLERERKLFEANVDHYVDDAERALRDLT